MSIFRSKHFKTLYEMVLFPVLVGLGPMVVYAYTNGGYSTVSLNTYTLTNDEKTVVFQTMSHIGLRTFYQEVGDEMDSYRKQGYRVLLEGVGSTGYKPLRKGDVGYEEAVDKYNQYFNKESTKMLNEMESQSIYKDSKYTYQNIELFRYSSYDDEYADLSYTTMYNLTDIAAKEAGIDQEAVDDYKNFDFSYSYNVNMLKASEPMYIFFQNLKGFPLFTLADTYVLPLIGEVVPAIKLKTEITINARDKNLVEHILAEPEKLIYVTYGSDHFKGVFENLQKIDPRWKIVKTTEKVVFKNG